MKFVTPSRDELALLRADPLIFEQELDARASVAEGLERALGFRAGRAYWRSAAARLYAIELADLGRGRPSMALIYGFWPRYEPRPVTEDEIDEDLSEMCLWVAESCDGLEVSEMQQVLDLAWAARAGGDTFRLPG
jgi:hypothetical protein